LARALAVDVRVSPEEEEEEAFRAERRARLRGERVLGLPR